MMKIFIRFGFGTESRNALTSSRAKCLGPILGLAVSTQRNRLMKRSRAELSNDYTLYGLCKREQIKAVGFKFGLLTLQQNILPSCFFQPLNGETRPEIGSAMSCISEWNERSRIQSHNNSKYRGSLAKEHQTFLEVCHMGRTVGIT